MSPSPPRLPLLAQLSRFGLVGLGATLVHAAVYGYAVGPAALAPLVANPLAFAVAFALSFLGHRHWTFAGQGDARALPRFLATALFGLASNQLLTWLLVARLGLPPLSALAGILFVTPLLVFVLAKHWAFAAPPSARTRQP